LFDAHPPFQIDGNFGCTSGITEMLMQSDDGVINLLPAVPDVWLSGGSITGLRARGGFQIMRMQWKDGRIVKVVIKSTLGGNLRLRVPNALMQHNGTPLPKATGENKNLFYQVSPTPEPVASEKVTVCMPQLKTTFLYDLYTMPGKTYTLVSQ
jgi:alpha-L-fucosidase 2